MRDEESGNSMLPLAYSLTSLKFKGEKLMEEILNEINETIVEETTPAEGIQEPDDTQPDTAEIPDIDTSFESDEGEVIVPVDWSEWDEHEFAEGEIFTNEYPPQAAVWCNEGGTHHIEEIEPDEDGNRRFQIVKNPEPTAEEIAQRKAMLNLTAADVERAIYKAKGMDFDDVVALVEQYNEAAPMNEEGQNTAIDIKALKIELKANNFYRGNPYIDAVGQLLGFTSDQLDNFFETGDYTALLT